MLQCVGERNYSSFFTVHAPEFLRDVSITPFGRFVEAVDYLEEFVP